MGCRSGGAVVRMQQPGAVIHADLAGRSRWPATAAPGPTACWTCGGCGRTSRWSAGFSAAAPGPWLPRSAAWPLRLCLPCNQKPGFRVQGSGQPHGGVTTAVGRWLLCERLQHRNQVKCHVEDLLIDGIYSLLGSVPVCNAACAALALQGGHGTARPVAQLVNSRLSCSKTASALRQQRPGGLGYRPSFGRKL